MPLVIEDGTGVANADSYQTLADARASAALLGLALPADDTETEIALRNGYRYVNGFEPSFSGTRTTTTQTGAWPRTDAYYCYGRNQVDIATDAIPADIVAAQMMAGVEYGKGTDVMPVDNGLSIASQEVVGAVKRSFFDNGKTGGEITITQAVDAMSALLCVSFGLSMRTNRV